MKHHIKLGIQLNNKIINSIAYRCSGVLFWIKTGGNIYE